MTWSNTWSLVKETGSDFMDDKAPRLAAALAYYTIFSLAPLLVITVMALGVFMKDSRDVVVGQLGMLMGDTGKQAAVEMLDHAQKSGGGIMATVISVVILLFGASGIFAELQDSLNTVWEVKPKPNAGWRQTLTKRFLSLAMVFGIAFLLLVSLCVSTVLTGIGERLFGGLAVVSHVLDFVLSFGVVTLLFAAMFRFLPDVKVRWNDVWIGAAITSGLFVIGRMLLGFYLAKGSTASAYGAAGSLAALLVWVYYSAQIMLFGAEFTQVYARSRGHAIETEEHAEPVTAEARARQGLSPSGKSKDEKPLRRAPASSPTSSNSSFGPDRQTAEDQTRRAGTVGVLCGAAAGAVLAMAAFKVKSRKKPSVRTRRMPAVVNSASGRNVAAPSIHGRDENHRPPGYSAPA